MPYITDEAKQLMLLTGATKKRRGTPLNSGELNFVLTMTVIDYLSTRGLSYQTCNDIVGALDNCKDEFKRRVQNPYEDRKIRENGDVYLPEHLEGGK